MKRKNRIWIYSLIIMGFAFILTSSCKKKDDSNSNSNNNNNITPPPPTTVTDIDGNVYHFVTIGSQVWMVENLRTKKFNDGTSVPEVTNNSAWISLTTPGFCWYNNDSVSSYGALYNWYAVNSGKLSPAGWHVASDADWKTLETTLGIGSLEIDNFGDWRGFDAAAGAQLKEAGTVHWATPNSMTTNAKGFTALPAGIRSFQDGSFSNYGYTAQFWASSAYDATDGYIRELSNDDIRIFRSAADNKNGQSVRCVKN
jgi:uncharacterized protein (TIGR02145 family)